MLHAIFKLRFVVVAVASLCYLSGSSLAAASEIVSVSGGPGGGWTVRAGGSEFYVVPIGGGYYWTGTPREYDIGRANGLARAMGMRGSIVADGATAAYVDRNSKRVSFASGGVDALQGYLVPAPSPRSRTLDAQRYLDFLWIQSRTINVTTKLLDLGTHRVWNPIRIDRKSSNEPYKLDEYSLGNSLAKDPIVLLVTVGKTTKGVAFRSAAWASYESRNTDIRNGNRMPDSDDHRDLALWRKLDPSLPSSFQVVAATTTEAAETASPRETDTPIIMAPREHSALTESPRVFVGSIVDELGGSGMARVTLLRDYDFFNGSVYVVSTTPPMVFTVHGKYDGDNLTFEMESTSTHCQYHAQGTLKNGRLEATYKPSSCARAHSGTITADRSP